MKWDDFEVGKWYTIKDKNNYFIIDRVIEVHDEILIVTLDSCNKNYEHYSIEKSEFDLGLYKAKKLPNILSLFYELEYQEYLTQNRR